MRGTALTNAGYYCFVADISSSTSTYGQLNTNHTNGILPLTFVGSTPTLASVNVS